MMLVLGTATLFTGHAKLNSHRDPRTYTRDAHAPVRRDAHAEVVKLNGWLHTSAFSIFLISKNLSWAAVNAAGPGVSQQTNLDSKKTVR
jgi:hypothetical protein